MKGAREVVVLLVGYLLSRALLVLVVIGAVAA
jgi:hypothetical protein